MHKILISSCLLGLPVRYDGGAKTLLHPQLQQWQQEGRLVAVCPEVAGGLATPRPPAEIETEADGRQIWEGQGKVIAISGEDVTAAFRRGAEHARYLARVHGIRLAILKASSPSCGNHQVYDGTFAGRKKPGQGVTAACLQMADIEVFNETEIERAARRLAELEQEDTT